MTNRLTKFLIAILLLTLPLQALGALEFGTRANSVKYNQAVFDDMPDGTMAMWAKTSTFDRQVPYSKNGSDNRLEFGASAGPVGGFINRVVDLNVNAATTTFAHYGLNKWMFIVWTWDLSTNGNNKLYIGDLDSFAQQPSSYALQTAGSGARTSDAAFDLLIGEHFLSAGREWDGPIANIYVADKVLSDAEVRQLQFGGTITDQASLILSTQIGYNGLGTQADWSGKINNGTASGTPATVAHVPLGFPFAQASNDTHYAFNPLRRTLFALDPLSILKHKF